MKPGFYKLNTVCRKNKELAETASVANSIGQPSLEFSTVLILLISCRGQKTTKIFGLNLQFYILHFEFHVLFYMNYFLYSI
jgi:hypothetical protein